MNVFVSTVDVFWRVLVVFSLALFGIAARKSGAFREEARQSLADIMLNITLPPLIFVSMTRDITWERLLSGAVSPFIALALVMIMMLVAETLGRLINMAPGRRGTFSVSTSMPNTAFIGFPVILSVLGQEGLAYAVLYDVGITVAFCSIAILALKGGLSQKGSWKSLINPPLIATVIGLLMNKLGIVIPDLALEPLRIMGNATVPLAMLLMGYMLGDVNFSLKALNVELGLVCACKLILYPLLAHLLMLPFNIDPLVRMVVIMESAMPSMASTPVLIQKYGGDSEFAVTALFVTTLLSVVTIPMMIAFLL
jgi:predicted permease